MSKQTRTHLKSRFSAGSIPKETDFADLFDSSYSLVDDNIILDVDGVKAIDVNLIPNLSADKTTSGQFSSDRIPDLNASKITGQLVGTQIADLEASKIIGELASSQIADLAASKITGELASSQIADLAASKITGELASSQIADLAASKITGELASSQIADLAASKITGELASSQIADLAASKITGELVSNQIADVAASKITGEIASSQIADLAASKITGVFASTQIPDLEPSKITGVFASTQIPDLDPSKIIGVFTSTQIPDLAASKITGELASSQIADLAASKITGELASSQIADLAASKITGELASSQIADLAASKITGELASNQIADLAASKITGELTSSQIADLAASKITGVLVSTQIPDLAAEKILTGILDSARIPSLAASKVATGQLGTARIPSMNASKITSGVLGSARLPSATTDATGIVQFATAQQLLNADEGLVVSPKDIQDSITTAAVATGERLTLLEASVEFLTDVDFVLDTPITVNSSNPTNIDGFSVSQDDRILLINQSDARNNRVWTVDATGDWVVADDFDEVIVDSSSIILSIGTSLKVLFGDTYGNTILSIATKTPITDNLSELIWRSRSDVYYGINGVVVTPVSSGNHEISVDATWMETFVQTHLGSYTTPIGSVIDWWSPEATPSIPAGWVETDGRTVTDGDVAYDPIFYNTTLPTITSTTSGSLKLIRVL